MKVDIPREVRNRENRVVITPAGVNQFVVRGHVANAPVAPALGLSEVALTDVPA